MPPFPKPSFDYDYDVDAQTNVSPTSARHRDMPLESTPVSSHQIETVYVARYRVFCHMASGVTRDVDAAHDAVQEGFARALGHRGDFRGEGSLDAWLWRIILRTAIERRRKTDRGSRWLTEVSEPEHMLWEPELPRADLDPELADALRALPPRQRLVVFLRYFVDLTHADIAAFCGMRNGTVSATLAQAKTTLAQRLGATSTSLEGKVAR